MFFGFGASSPYGDELPARCQLRSTGGSTEFFAREKSCYSPLQKFNLY
jgi:hypothetical protein